MNKVHLLSLNGQTRKVGVSENKEEFILSDDNKEIILNKKYPIRLDIQHVKDNMVVSKTQTIFEAEKFLIYKLLTDFNFDVKHQNSSFENLDMVDNGESFKKLIQFSENYKNQDLFRSVLLYGEESWGCGKTHSINALANKWFGEPRTEITFNKFGEIIVKYAGASFQIVREEDLLLKVLSTYKKEAQESELEIYQKYDKYDILAIDDIGKHKQTNLEFFRRVMFQIVDTRYNKGKGVIISANFGKDDLKKIFGFAVADRLNEMTRGYKLEFKGESHRRQD